MLYPFPFAVYRYIMIAVLSPVDVTAGFGSSCTKHMVLSDFVPQNKDLYPFLSCSPPLILAPSLGSFRGARDLFSNSVALEAPSMRHMPMVSVTLCHVSCEIKTARIVVDCREPYGSSGWVHWRTGIEEVCTSSFFHLIPKRLAAPWFEDEHQSARQHIHIHVHIFTRKCAFESNTALSTTVFFVLYHETPCEAELPPR